MANRFVADRLARLRENLAPVLGVASCAVQLQIDEAHGTIGLNASALPARKAAIAREWIAATRAELGWNAD